VAESIIYLPPSFSGVPDPDPKPPPTALLIYHHSVAPGRFSQPKGDSLLAGKNDVRNLSN